MIDKRRYFLITVILIIWGISAISAQEVEDITSEPEVMTETQIEEEAAEEIDEEKYNPLDHIHVYVDNKMIFALSVPEGGFGFGETLNVQYTLPFNLNIGLEGGYYGFRSEIEEESVSVVGGFTVIPFFLTTSYDFYVMENFYISPVLKAGGAYLRSRLNGWMAGDAFAFLFEGGGRVGAYLNEGLLIQGEVTYTGIVEKSGLFSIMSIGFGLGF